MEFYEAVQSIVRAQQRDEDVSCAWGITIPECHTLELLVAAGEIGVNGLAKQLGVDKSTASRTVAKLVEKGLAMREVHPDSARAVRLTATDAGRRLFARVSRANHASYAKALAGLQPRDRKRVLRALQDAARLLSTLKPEPLD